VFAPVVVAVLSLRPPGVPPRPADAPGGAAVMARLAKLPPVEREDAIAAELLRGNLPEFLRTLVPVTVAANAHTITYRVTPDYLAVGSDADFVRVPMRPATAQRVADAWGFTLTTRKMCDDIYRAAAVKLEPRPLVTDREKVGTFVQHHEIVERQRAGTPLGALVAGIKKDVVVTNRFERATRPGGDLRLAQAGRGGDPAVVDRPRAVARRLQPRRPARGPGGAGGRPAAGLAGGRGRPEPVPAGERRRAAHPNDVPPVRVDAAMSNDECTRMTK
jgi:hypothetical protein